MGAPSRSAGTGRSRAGGARNRQSKAFRDARAAIVRAAPNRRVGNQRADLILRSSGRRRSGGRRRATR